MSHSITDDILRAVVAELGEEFDSHDVIFSIMRRHPREYATDLYGLVESDDPILSLHASLGRRLLGLDELTPTKRIKSMNVRGEETENQQWRRKK
ncbi:MAG: hypothetical protein IPH44_38500 [Myxococcales bacterium]|nr:hypothetical protein [Myxococcales bacterium]MBK7197617.1 hypothetical protein [Myxococcales bacterium]